MYAINGGYPYSPYFSPQAGQIMAPGMNGMQVPGMMQNAPQGPQNAPHGIAQNQSAQSLQGAPFDGLTRVTGMQGAKAYQMPSNSRVALFDDTEDIVIIKMTDGAGFPSCKRARLDWIPDEPETEYMTRAEFQKQFDELKGLILNNGKQSIRKSKSGDTGDVE